MRLIFDYADQVGAGFDEAALARLAEETLRAARDGDALAHKTITLDVAVVDAATIQKVNKEYRDTDDVTDVISIGSYSDDQNIGTETQDEIFLGELVLCWSDIQKNATIQGTEDTYEFAYVFTHGILHLLGYAHGSDMFDLQDCLSTDFCAGTKKRLS